MWFVSFGTHFLASMTSMFKYFILGSPHYYPCRFSAATAKLTMVKDSILRRLSQEPQQRREKPKPRSGWIFEKNYYTIRNAQFYIQACTFCQSIPNIYSLLIFSIEMWQSVYACTIITQRRRPSSSGRVPPACTRETSTSNAKPKCCYLP